MNNTQLNSLPLLECRPISCHSSNAALQLAKLILLLPFVGTCSALRHWDGRKAKLISYRKNRG